MYLFFVQDKAVFFSVYLSYLQECFESVTYVLFQFLRTNAATVSLYLITIRNIVRTHCEQLSSELKVPRFKS